MLRGEYTQYLIAGGVVIVAIIIAVTFMHNKKTGLRAPAPAPAPAPVPDAGPKVSCAKEACSPCIGFPCCPNRIIAPRHAVVQPCCVPITDSPVCPYTFRPDDPSMQDFGSCNLVMWDSSKQYSTQKNVIQSFIS